MDTKTAILRTALKLFIENGYSGTSIKNITDAMGITKGALYHHYKNKDDIYVNALDLFMKWSGHWFKERIQKAENLRELLNIYFDFSDYFPVETTDDVYNDRWSLILDAIKRFPPVKTSVKKNYYGNISLIKQHIEHAVKTGEISKSVDSDSIAKQIIFITDGLFFYSVISGDEKELIKEGLRMKSSLINLLYTS